MLFPQNIHLFHSKLPSCQSTTATCHHRLRWRLSLDASAIQPRPLYTAKDVYEQFIKLYHSCATQVLVLRQQRFPMFRKKGWIATQGNFRDESYASSPWSKHHNSKRLRYRLPLAKPTQQHDRICYSPSRCSFLSSVSWQSPSVEKTKKKTRWILAVTANMIKY